MGDEITKPEMKMLERIFAHEVESAIKKGGLPNCFQSKAKKVLVSLAAKGLIEPTSFDLGRGPFTVHVEGWQLTALGHMTYCMSC